LDEAFEDTMKIMESAVGVSGPYINGMYNGGHFGGYFSTLRLMKPSWLLKDFVGC